MHARNSRSHARRYAGFLAAILLAAAAQGCRDVPTEPVQPTGQWRHVSVGAYNTCAITMTDVAYCWGRNGACDRYGCGVTGMVGDSTSLGRFAPTRVAGAHVFSQVSVGSAETCGLATPNQTFCWGGGNGNFPRPVPRDPGFATLGVGGNVKCGIRAEGTIYCWPGFSTSLPRDPAPIPGGGTYSSILLNPSGASYHCAISTLGKPSCFDYDSQRTPTAPVPVRVEGRFVSFGTAYDGGCGVLDTGVIRCWDHGGVQITRSPLDSGALIPEQSSREYSSISLGIRNGCAIDKAGVLYCWGNNSDGQLGNGTILVATASPVAVASEVRFQQVSVGELHACAISLNRDLYCWGNNFNGALGIGQGGGDNARKWVPTLIAPAS